MNWEIKIISKTLMTKISWGGYDKGFYGTLLYGIQIQNQSFILLCSLILQVQISLITKSEYNISITRWYFSSQSTKLASWRLIQSILDTKFEIKGQQKFAKLSSLLLILQIKTH